MFEQYNENAAVQYTSSGKRIAAYNTELHTSRILSAEEGDLLIQRKQITLIYPSSATWQRKQEISRKAADENLVIKDTISEAEALVRYHCFQNKGTVKPGLVRVIDIHKYNTDITVVQIDNNRIKPVFGQCVPVGGETLTEKMFHYYMEKLKRVKGDISGDTRSAQMLREMAEEAKMRMGNHRMKTDEFIFHSPNDNIKYLLRVFREDYNQMIDEIMEIIFSADRKLMIKAAQCGYNQPYMVILGGGMNNCEYNVRVIKEKYVSQTVLAYKCREASALGAAIFMVERRR